MPRRPSVRYWPSRKGYCVKLNGVQHLLASGPDDYGNGNPPGPTYQAALDRFKGLMEVGQLDTAGDGNTVRAILDQYLCDVERQQSPRTLAIRLRYCRHFAGRWGELPCAHVRPYHATSLLDESPDWSGATRRLYLMSLKAGFNWAVKQELITRNPLRNVALPSNRTAARERTLTPDEYKRILATLATPSRQCLRRLVIALENTGARPGELLNATVADWHGDIGAIVYYRDDVRREDEHRHKTAGRDKDRVIYFTGEALAMVREFVKGKPAAAPMFPNRRGRKYASTTLVNCFLRIRDRVGMPWLVAYSFRHTLATNWLMKGGSVDLLATMLGNTPETIRRHYAHLLGRHDDIRAAIERFRAGS